MGEKSAIEWTDHTFNPWRGCTKVAAGCEHCYAARDAKRFPNIRGIWGNNGTRVVAAESMWRKPVSWHRQAMVWPLHLAMCKLWGVADPIAEWKRRDEGNDPPFTHRPRVFCASLADIFEDWPDLMMGAEGEPRYVFDDKFVRAFECNGIPAPGESGIGMNTVRQRLFKLIDDTPYLDWLILTKRPENIPKMWPTEDDGAGGKLAEAIFGKKGKLIWKRPNVWIGTSIANQADAERNIPLLLKCRELAPVLFLSMEPMVGPVELKHLINGCQNCDDIAGCDCDEYPGLVDWIIAGGESGPDPRPFCLEWDDDIRRQCQAAGVPFFNKQLGSFPVTTNCNFWDFEPSQLSTWGDAAASARIKLKDDKGGDWNEWPEELRVRHFPKAEAIANA